MQTVNANETTANAAEAMPVDLPIALKEGTGEVLIPLKRLVASPYNQRKTKRDPVTIEAIADNILAVNLLQNLVVHPVKVTAKKAQTYGVDAGETRRLALLLNVERGHITMDFPVRCIVVTEAEAILASASENDLRVPPHPADQFLAYKALADEGRSPEFIAAVFKVTPKTVAGHLKLAAVSPKLFDLFASDQMSLEQIKALAITDDHARQEAAWFGAQQEWHKRPNELRGVLQGENLSFGNSLVRFVTVAAYEAAGGVVERDLFATRDEGFIVNRDLLNRLFDEKIANVAATVKAEGWSWVEARPSLDYDERNLYATLQAEQAPLTPEQQAEYDRLTTRSNEIQARLEASYDAEEGEPDYLTEEAADALQEEADSVDQSIEAIDGRDGDFTPEQMAVSGAIVTISHAGEVVIHRALVRREDRAQARAQLEESGATIPRSLNQKAKGVHSEKLILNLTAHRTAAVQSALSQNPHVALVTLAHKLALDYLYTGYLDGASVVQVSSKEAYHDMQRAAPEIAQTQHASGLEAFVESWQSILPKNPNLLFGWLLEQPQERLLNLLAVCTSLSINGVAREEGPNGVNAIAGALNLDLSNYWQPTKASYFQHVSKDRITAIVGEVVSKEEAARLSKMKKGEAADAAEKLLEGRNWLPEFLAAAQVKEVRFYDNEDDADEDSEDEMIDTSGVDEESNDAVSAADANESTPEPVSADAAPWPFPRAADFAAHQSDAHAAEEHSDANDVTNSGSQDDESTRDSTTMNVWPFPPTNPQALLGVRHAA